VATPLVTGSSVNDQAQYTTTAIQPTGGALILAFVSNVRRALTSGTLATPTLSSPGLTWELVDSVLTEDNERRLSCLRARGPAPARGAAVIGFADQIQEMCAWSVVEYTDIDVSGLNGSGAIGFSKPAKATGTRLDATFTPANAARDRTIAAIMLQPPDGQARPVTPGSGFVAIHEQTPAQLLGKALTLQTQDAAPGVTTVGWTWTGNQNAAALIVGIKAVRVDGPKKTGNPTIDLGRQYEPILHLHPTESFAPVNAKRYVEAAALWAATRPFDDKTNWGTTPLVKVGQLTAVQNEPGDYLGKPDHIVADATHERFLEVGGWKNRDEASEPSVTGASTNPYVDRTEILRRYGTDLADSKFWYHVELFDTARLKALAAKVAGGFDLTATLTRNFANPILLCYYFFYPAHEQSIGEDACANIEAKEFASHAGDWHCFALLLDGQGPPSPDAYTPLFFGVTGSRPAPDVTGGKETFRPHAFDSEGRVTLKVEPWRKGSASTAVQPDVVDGHPQFYVARGSHSMYTTPGEHEVSPFEDSKVPAGCGKFDSPSAIPPPPPPDPPPAPDDSTIFDNGWVMILVKMCAGFLNPVGVVIGLVAGIIEGIPKITTPFGAGSSAPGPPPAFDPPNADAAPTAPGQGITVRPEGLAIPGITENLFNWEADQGVQSPAGRTYDFVVDRTTQVWWPSDDGTKGFRGRWGQRVASDPVPHRAGVKFPEFWKMMLTALEQGFGEGTLTRPRP
jgi:hypothetical protein